MTYLDICRRVNDIVGFQGTINTVDTTGYQSTLTTAVKDAYEDIQRYRKDWDWMKKNRTINIASGTDFYTLEELWAGETVDLAEYRYINYDYKRMRELGYDAFELIDWSDWESEPKEYAINPQDKSLLISPVDQVYTLDLYYISTLQELANNGDVPILPARHQQLIVYSAILKLSTFVGNATLYDTYSVKTAEGMGQLMREENPYREIRKRPIA